MKTTTYLHQWRSNRGEIKQCWTKDPEPPRFASSAIGTSISTSPHLHDYTEGSAVTVRAYGRPRSGRVTGLGRTRIMVEFVRNASGERDERPFSAIEIRPMNCSNENCDPNRGES